MGVKFIKSSRKEYKCSKCGDTLPVGSSYYKGEVFRMRPIVCCTKCGLKGYEVTTSEYARIIGRLCEDWREDFTIGCDIAEDIILEVLNEQLDNCQESLDNLPEQFQEGSVLQERVEELEGVIDELGYFDWDEVVEEGYNDLDEDDVKVIDIEMEKREAESCVELYEDFREINVDVFLRWEERVTDAVISFIDGALSGLTY